MRSDFKARSPWSLPGAALLVIALLVGAGASAGPLDREPSQHRYNPAAENMLRVPGVVGLDEGQALDVLQQAGLAVKVKRIKEDHPRYSNKEGQVVAQVPAAGGVAMVGSTVAITVYKWPQPGSEYPQNSCGEVDTEGWVPPQPAPPEMEEEPEYEGTQ